MQQLYCFVLSSFEHMNCMQLNYLVCINLPRGPVYNVALNPDARLCSEWKDHMW